MHLFNSKTSNNIRFSWASLPACLLCAGKLQAGTSLSLKEVQAELPKKGYMRDLDSFFV
jgi:hypothetical protein